MQVLIVDDDDFALNVLEHTLSRVGYTAVSAHEGSEAMDILRRGEIRVVITDWDMPGMNGLDLVRATRQENCPATSTSSCLLPVKAPRMEGLWPVPMISLTNLLTPKSSSSASNKPRHPRPGNPRPGPLRHGQAR